MKIRKCNIVKSTPEKKYCYILLIRVLLSVSVRRAPTYFFDDSDESENVQNSSLVRGRTKYHYSCSYLIQPSTISYTKKHNMLSLNE